MPSVSSRFGLIVFLSLPVLMVAGMLYYGIDAPRVMHAPPVGAGAGSTGGANAIGNLMAGRSPLAGDVRFEKSSAGGESAAEVGGGAASAVQPAAQPQFQPQMVQPESLPQGYVIIVDDKTKLAKESSPIYFASSLNAWNPGDAKYKLQPQSDGKWRIILPQKQGDGIIEFKFTRGSWALEELDDNLNPISNRTLPKIDASKLAPGEQPKIEFIVPHWGDQRATDPNKRATDPYRELQVTGEVRRLQVRGGGGTVGPTLSRDLFVWLPPGYEAPENAGRAYPVLYMQDGQNLFEQLPGVPGEWKVDETATKLVTAGVVEPLIIVGIPHAGAGRASEYLPVPALDGVQPGGDQYVDFLVREVMPRVERAFRVKTGPEFTGVGGSSMGGLIAIHAAMKHPELFGLVLAESPSLRLSNPDAMKGYLDSIAAWPGKIVLGMGGKEGGPEPEKAKMNQAYIDAVKQLNAKAQAAGLGPDRLLLLIDPEAVHNENAWAKRFPDALQFLYPAAGGKK